MSDDNQTIDDLLDMSDPARTSSLTRRRIQAARQELEETVDQLTGLLEGYPEDLTDCTPDELRELLRGMQLAGNVLSAQWQETAVALDDLEADTDE